MTFDTSVIVSGLLSSAFTQASSKYEMIAVQRCILTAFSEYPQRDFMVRFPFIHLKNGLFKNPSWKELHHLREDKFALTHNFGL